ncbi:MAG: 16S rRNA (cytosine(1402)-N(4))-methyltransferase RsmH [Bacteroidaceae bacterium]|nr:16S rRNA (cytosine(1402)-N(4))-methyltransferase RsmH [Bacteroidaceae bacterium]
MPVANEYHIPVMLKECVEALNIHEEGTWVDVTYGGGGHSRAILEAMSGSGRLFSFDQDQDTLENLPDDKNFTLVYSNFRFLRNWMRYYGVEQIDGLLADLGVSSHHFDVAERGFSFREDGPLDMRMNAHSRTSAADIVNTYSAEQLADILYFYGELRQSRQIAAAIVKTREQKPLRSTGDLFNAVQSTLGKAHEKKDLAKVFQALRIEVNHEMEALNEMLTQAVELLKPGGRLVVMTYHSLEDRIVKNFIRSGNAEGKIESDFYGNRLAPLRAVNNKVITPSSEEQATNPRSRSAKLRIGEKI